MSVSEVIDRFYMKTGPCCAGCDWWASINSVAGECRRSAPVPSAQRITMLGIRLAGSAPDAGHVMTLRDHHCGDFKDEFDWKSLGAFYLRKIGYQPATEPQGGE